MTFDVIHCDERKPVGAGSDPAVDRGLAFTPEQRPQTIDVWRPMFGEAIPLAEEAPTVRMPVAPSATPRLGGAIRVGHYKLVLNGGGADDPDGEPAPKKKAKAAGKDAVELFDLTADPFEKTNLAAAMPDR